MSEAGEREPEAGIASGDVDIVVGTHALLAESVKFRDLGLMIIDEEQHFGVKHKERLKEMKAGIHVLTLTATPIPRTLQLALSGVRELSLITTPPLDRLAVRTYITPFDPVIIRESLLREHFRGGQSFYVVPRVTDLDEIAAFLRESVPEVKFRPAHGRMAPTELEDIMTGFYDRKFDVLLSTTIVESGLDISTANTLIIHRADMFGHIQNGIDCAQQMDVMGVHTFGQQCTRQGRKAVPLFADHLAQQAADTAIRGGGGRGRWRGGQMGLCHTAAFELERENKTQKQQDRRARP